MGACFWLPTLPAANIWCCDSDHLIALLGENYLSAVERILRQKVPGRADMEGKSVLWTWSQLPTRPSPGETWVVGLGFILKTHGKKHSKNG